MKKSLPALVSVMVLLLLLTHPNLSARGAGRGLLLWYQTLLPTLLPFMILSNVIVSLNGIRFLTLPFSPILKHVLRLSDAGGYVFVSGLLCGYPMGAKTCSDFVAQKRISLSEGRYLLAFSSYPSPMFLLGYVASLVNPAVPPLFLLIAMYLPILPIALLSRLVYGIHGPCASLPLHDKEAPSFDQSMMASFEVMVKIGGYIMLFSILAEFVGQAAFLPGQFRALLLGAVELTTGIRAAANAYFGSLQGALLCSIAAFGGVCGLFQTKSVLKSPGLSIVSYLFWKLLHSALCAGIFMLLATYCLPVR